MDRVPIDTGGDREPGEAVARGRHAPRYRQLFRSYVFFGVAALRRFGEGAETCTRGRVRSPEQGATGWRSCTIAKTNTIQKTEQD